MGKTVEVEVNDSATASDDVSGGRPRVLTPTEKDIAKALVEASRSILRMRSLVLVMAKDYQAKNSVQGIIMEGEIDKLNASVKALVDRIEAILYE